MTRLRRQKKKHTLTLPELTLTPLIDTVLVLLVVFMMTTPLLHNSITVELPASASNDDTEQIGQQKTIKVTIDKARNLFIDETQVAREHFFKELEKRVAGSQDIVVFVYADESIPYGVVVNIVDDIKYLGGIKYVALATERL